MKTAHRLTSAAFWLTILSLSAFVVRAQCLLALMRMAFIRFSMPRVAFRAHLFLLALLLPTTVRSQFSYSITDGEVTITGYDCSAMDVVIPETIEGLPVTRIAGASPSDQSGGFSRDIYIGAFEQCSELETVSIPASVIEISTPIFCINAIYVDPLNPAYTSLDGVLFNKEMTSLLNCPKGKPGHYAVPESVTDIGQRAFRGCASLTGITIPESVTNIGGAAFAYCASLTSLVIPDSVASLPSTYGIGCNEEYYMFDGCTSLGDLFIGKNVTGLRGVEFSGCVSLTSITVDPESTDYSSRDGVLFDKAQATMIWIPRGKSGNYALPEGVTSLGENTFNGCRNLTSVTIPDSLGSIPDYAFGDCTGLASITLGGKVRSIGEYAFYNCAALASINITRSVSSIGNFAFLGCVSLTEINVHLQNLTYSSVDGVLLNKSQTKLLFYPSGRPGGYTIPSTVTSIREFAFYCSPNLTSVTIPSNVTSIGSWTFESCQSLTGINVDPQNRAFASMEGILFNKNKTTLIQYPPGRPGGYSIPDGVKSVADFAFESCENLTSIAFPDSLKTIGLRAFLWCYGLTSVSFGEGITSIGISAFELCTNLTSVTLPASVTNLEPRAFLLCTKLKSAYFRGNAPSSESVGFSLGFENATVFYQPGTSGWTSTFAGRPTAMWIALVLSLPSQPQTTPLILHTTSPAPSQVRVQRSTDLIHWEDWQTVTKAAGPSTLQDADAGTTPYRFYRGVQE